MGFELRRRARLGDKFQCRRNDWGGNFFAARCLTAFVGRRWTAPPAEPTMFTAIIPQRTLSAPLVEPTKIFSQTISAAIIPQRTLSTNIVSQTPSKMNCRRNFADAFVRPIAPADKSLNPNVSNALPDYAKAHGSERYVPSLGNCGRTWPPCMSVRGIQNV